ncbi:MAG: hypothetical protein H7145_14055, partial [Akkermansiaceae bacterium]|nr:hypothetical protein [Armatimonadota bacterium]
MEITRLADLKSRTVWEITDDAFDLYRERFALLVSVSAVVFAPAYILASTVGVAAVSDFNNIFEGPDELATFAISMAWLIPVLTGAYILHFGATALAVRDILTGETATLVNVYKRAFRRIFPLLLASLVIGAIGFVVACTTVGPILVAAYYCFTVHGILLEERKLGEALKRSVDMTKSYFGKSLGLLCLMASIILALVVGIESLVALLFAIVPKESGTAGTAFEMKTAEDVVSAVAGSVIAVVIAPLPAIATTLLYYDLRVRREGLDVESEAAEWGVVLAPDPFGGV